MNKKKALIVATVSSTIDQFCMNDITVLQQLGYKVHVYANFIKGNNTSASRIEEFRQELKKMGIIVHQGNLTRNPLHISNILEYFKIKKILKEQHYTIVHCHTPIASLITRLAANKFRKKGLKVVYTAHGFHFYKGAPVINWILYYPLEFICSRLTDILITINQEDYSRAKKKMRVKIIKKMPGVGIHTRKFDNVGLDILKKRIQLDLKIDDFVILSIGELNKNKNHEVIIRAISQLKEKNIQYIIAGKGDLENYLKKLTIELNVEDRVKFLGYRRDIPELCKISDVFCFPSYREGLSVALMEVMTTGLPVICSQIRGNTDLIDHELGGYLCRPNDVEAYKRAIRILLYDEIQRKRMGSYNLEKSKAYDKDNVEKILKTIYEEIESDKGIN